jgi:multicomponent Na+:H+ antiporter subunit D
VIHFLANVAALAVQGAAHGAAQGMSHGAPLQAPDASNLPILIVLPLIAGVIAVPGLGLIRRRLAHAAMVVVVLALLAASLAALRQVLVQGPLHYKLAGWTPPIGIEFVLDPLSAFVVLVIAVVALMVTIYAGSSVRRQNPEREVPFFAMMIMLLLGLCGMVMTGDLFNLYVFFEISSLSAYALMAIGDRKAPVSSFRYLLQGTIGASFYLLGVGYLYVLTGSLNMADVAGLLPGLMTNPALTVALVFMVAGLSLKAALFPLHLWLPDAYTYASATSTSIIAPLMTKVSAYVLIRMLYFVYGSEWALSHLQLGAVIAWLSMLGVIWGSCMAIAQRDPKRMLAYSSIAQVGYIGVGIGTGNYWALVGAILHIMNHAAMKSSLFMTCGIVEMQTGRHRLDGWTGLGRKMPWTFVGFAFAAIAMVGLPPTNGFFSKWYLALGLARAHQWVLLVLLILSGLLTAGYFFRVLERIYARVPEGAGVAAAGASGEAGAVAGGAATAAVAVTPRDPGLALVLPPLLLGVGTLALGLVNAWFVSAVILKALPVALQIQGLGG